MYTRAVPCRAVPHRGVPCERKFDLSVGLDWVRVLDLDLDCQVGKFVESWRWSALREGWRSSAEGEAELKSELRVRVLYSRSGEVDECGDTSFAER